MAVDVDATDGQLSGTEIKDLEDAGEIAAGGDVDGQIAPEVTKTNRFGSPVRRALAAGVSAVAALAALSGWLTYQAHQAYQTDQQRRVLLQVGRQAAVNLTTIDYTRVDADVARILDSATGAFRDEFEHRAQPFIEAVKKMQSKSEGRISEAALESVHGDEAQVLVAVQVKTALPGVPDQGAKGWRMRIDLRKTGANVKVSNVAFVT